MKSLLYYPYINLPQNDWTIRALLYYDNVNAIVPTQYFYEPEHYNPFMREAIMNELITPINPMDVLNNPYEVSLRFIEYLSARKSVIERRRSFFQIKHIKFTGINSYLHTNDANCMQINLIVMFLIILWR